MHGLSCNPARVPQLSRCMSLRLTGDLGTVRSSWGPAVKRALASGTSRVGSISELAREIGMVRQHLSDLLNSRRPTIAVDTYLAVCGVLDMDPKNYVTDTHDSRLRQ